eukprot:snap_masked-scaffold_1-processed-gene-6.30-mRNA-1 protein AED:0.43 eAED:0.43 QI:0/0/0/0.5/1/1/2/0/709
MGNQASASLPYKIEGEIPSKTFPFLGFKVFDGKAKSDGSPVTILKLEKSDLKGIKDKSKIWELAKNFFKRSKILRHPNLLTFLDGIETSDLIIIVTEKSLPLSDFLTANLLTKQELQMILSWGTVSLLQALKFVNVDCKSFHGLMFPPSPLDSIGRTLGHLSLENPNILPATYCPKERRFNEVKRMYSDISKVDIFGLGCIIFECFNGKFYDSGDVYDKSKLAKLPQMFQSFVKNFTISDFDSRPGIENVFSSQAIQKLRNISFCKTMNFFEEANFKTNREKIEFLTELEKTLGKFPRVSLSYKLIPSLKKLLEFENMRKGEVPNVGGKKSIPSAIWSCVLKIMDPIMKSDSTEKEQVLDQVFLPAMYVAFSSKDRQGRLEVLKSLPLFIEYIPQEKLNKPPHSLFTRIISGFSDNSVAMKEATLRAITVIAGKLDSKNINDVVIKALLKLLEDPQPSIITNTVVCLSKLLGFFSEETRVKVIMGVFPKALKSSQHHTRTAGIKAIISSLTFFVVDDANSLKTREKIIIQGKHFATKILPSLALAMVDGHKTVRNEAKIAIHKVVSKLEEVSQLIESKIEDSGQGDATEASGAWGSNITKYSKKIASSIGYEETKPKPRVAEINIKKTEVSKPLVANTSSEIKLKKFSTFESMNNNFAEMDMGEEEDDLFDNLEENDLLSMEPEKKVSSKTADNIVAQEMEEDDFFSNF